MASKSKRTLWNKLGRVISGLVIGCFFLPFFGVSCEGMDVVTVSGGDMVGGCKPGGLISDAADQSEREGASHGGRIEAKLDNVEREPLAIVAFVLVLASFALAWMRTRKALLASFIVAIAGLATLGGLYVTVSGKIHDAVEKQTKEGGGGLGAGAKKDAEISSGGRMGLWLDGIGLLTIAVITGLALREKDDPAEPAAQLAPPAG
jgi:hypothetical protein